MRQLLAYPFGQLGVFKMWAVTPLDNARARRIMSGVGMHYEAKLEHHFGEGKHAVIMCMFRPDWWRGWMLGTKKDNGYGQIDTIAA